MEDERPDGWNSTCNFHICYARVRTMRGSRPDGWSRIGNFHIRCTHVRTEADWCPDSDIWIAILTLRRRASGRDTTSFGRLIDLENWNWLLKVKCVHKCQKKLSTAENKRHKFLLTKWKLNQEKNHSGAAKPRNSTIQKTKLDTR
jgi:hypothetical protein